jgi:hypothetical protein
VFLAGAGLPGKKTVGRKKGRLISAYLEGGSRKATHRVLTDAGKKKPSGKKVSVRIPMKEK